MDEAYFRDYCGHGAYDEQWQFHSGAGHCTSIMRRLGGEVRSMVVLGTATGRVLEHFEQTWGLRPWGCEISAWAHARIPGHLRRRIRLADMRDYVPREVERGRRHDLLFTNSLVYLRQAEVEAFAAQCARLAGWMHFYSSTREDHEPGDRYRVTLQPRRWWRERFIAAGFRPTRSPYVWRSQVTSGRVGTS